MKLPISKKVANWIIEKAMKTPYFHLEGYMNRYWLLPYGRQIFAARVHHILRSDDDRAFHDHPWPYLSIVLKGGYHEIRPKYDKSGLFISESRIFYGPGSIIYRPARSWHRLEIPNGQTAWTLFITGPWQQAWGFLPNPKTKVHYKSYLANDLDTHPNLAAKQAYEATGKAVME